jgi:late competence protein required for DNA uptake (superfamily II DNA/RNA helicase)
LTLRENHEFITGLCSQKDRQNSIAKSADRHVQVTIGTCIAFRGVNFRAPAVAILRDPGRIATRSVYTETT